VKFLTNLRIPGPTPCRREVLEAVARPMMNYRGPEMAVLVEGLVGKLQRFLETEHDIVLLTASGTGGLEAVIQNVLSPGDRVVGVDAGVFGKRFIAVAEAFGASVRTIDVDWGRALEPDTLGRVLREERACRAVLLTHNETSTGVRHPIEELAEVVRSESDALLCVDGVSSLGAMPLPMDALGIDVVISGSQKAWGVPPGMAILCLSSRAWHACEQATMPRFYFDLRRYRAALSRGSFPFTPSLPIVFGLDVALDFMLRETAAGVFARHARIAARAREGIRNMGLELFSDEDHPSPTVTAIRVPDTIDEPALVELLVTKHDTVYARGQEKLRGGIVRLGHLGWVQESEIDAALDALRLSIEELASAK
jgi:aspartate aminotransferase-like enzyme